MNILQYKFRLKPQWAYMPIVHKITTYTHSVQLDLQRLQRTSGAYMRKGITNRYGLWIYRYIQFVLPMKYG